MKRQILVIGYGEETCTEEAYDIAYQVGVEISRQGSVLLTGGLGGVMEAASKGAKENGGLVVGIIPQEDKSYANQYCDVVISTGVGYSRDFITAYSADAIIIVGGGVGTFIEACAAYLKSKPLIAIEGSGGIADKVANTYLDERCLVKVVGESSPKKAVEKALSLLVELGEKKGG